MAYINKDQVKEIRDQIKAEFPAKEGWLFSIRNHHHMEVSVEILRAPVNLLGEDNPDYETINHYHLNWYTGEKREILEKITKIANKGNFDKSDIQTDYFHVGWYFSLSIGRWDRPFELAKTNKTLTVS